MKILFKWIFEKCDEPLRDSFDSGYGPVAGSCERDDEPSGFTNSWKHFY
jgi:hypothetical protein